MWQFFIFGGIAALFLLMTGWNLLHLRWCHRLPRLTNEKGEVTKCSVIIAARDEQDRIEATLRHLLAQTGVDLEIIVVNDRSSDRTPEILNRIAKENSRL